MIILITLLVISLLSAQIKEDDYIEEIVYLEEDSDYNIVKVLFDLEGWHDNLYNVYLTHSFSIVGDDVNYFTQEKSAVRKYYRFPFQNPPETWEIESITLNVYQNGTMSGVYTNVWPSFYGNSNHGLKVALCDFNIENLSSSFNATNFMEIGEISNNASVGWKQLDVTQAYLLARNSIEFTDFPLMLYFDYITDYDNGCDLVGISHASTSNQPYLEFRYHDTTPTYEGECEIAQTNLQCYPNPVSDLLSIKSDSSININQISIYNIKGQKVFTKETQNFSKGEISLNLPENLASGIYFVKCKIDGNLQTITKKIFVK
jgi:hypothetical protein